MSPNEPVEPTPFDAAPARGARATSPANTEGSIHNVPAQSSNIGVLIGLLALALLLVLVFFWLPQKVPDVSQSPTAPASQNTAPAEHGKTAETAAPTRPAPATASAPVNSADKGATPWSDAQNARLRRESQDVLADLLDLQFSLEEQGVQHWAAAEINRVKESAAQGDALYKERRYANATQAYRRALVAAQAIEARIAQIRNELLLTAEQALNEGEGADAETALKKAGLIAPQDAQLQALEQRAQNLSQVMALLNTATGAMQSGDYTTAQAMAREATVLDPQHPKVAALLAEATAAADKAHFSQAMSEGYAALAERRYGDARKAFRRAAAIDSSSAEVASAQRQVDSAATAQRLVSLQQQGAAAERKEQWQKAVTIYEKAQKIDSSVLFAAEGLARSRDRAELDAALQAALKQTERYSDVAIAKQAEAVLERARRAQPSGAVLRQQTERLAQVLRDANTPISVTLQSDGATDVVMYKVAKLGQFQQRELQLRPGSYTIVGSRRGYRDVRRVVTVSHNQAIPAVRIVCSEPI